MEITQDRDRFDKRQEQFLRRLMERIKRDLEAAGIPADKLHDLTSEIGFSVSSLLDGCEVDRGARPLLPVLAFAEDKSRARLLVEPNGSWLHENVDAVADDLFDDEDVTEEEARFRKCLLDYCAAQSIEVPPPFGRRGVMRYAVIRTDRTPHKLVAVTWGLLADVTHWMEGSLAPEVGERLCDSVRVLDLHARQVLGASKGLVFTSRSKF